ncbi:toxin-antitoxin system YwqK family antitoxin [Fulvivirga sediminis]|uniref:MORN repeat variant n=1 Tax=Fulvivirga sediminis TaxID=2803949 RepID=A0A937JZF4_9BACT|nr:hypothetical protein [Fulvivirga sediminis]MBL3655136.1 hypothetical protein [Fulvivirga sediminis]
MENKIVFLILFVLITTSSYSQTKEDRYIKLSQFESEEYLANPVKTGNAYLIHHQDKGKVRSLEIKKYKNGQKDGEWLAFLRTIGAFDLVNVTNYKNGLKHGYFFNTDNHVYSEEGYYKKGEKHGAWIKKNYEDVETIETTTYKKGKKHGVYSLIQVINEKSVVLKKEYYKHDKLIKETVNSTLPKL